MGIVCVKYTIKILPFMEKCATKIGILAQMSLLVCLLGTGRHNKQWHYDDRISIIAQL